MFSLSKEISPAGEYLLARNENTGEYFSVYPQYGGNLNELSLSSGDAAHALLRGYDDANGFRSDNRFRGIVMLPFPNRVRDGRYEFDGVRYQLPINEPELHHALHGFFRDRSLHHSRTEVQEDRISVTLEHRYEGDYAGYPFPFQTEIKYSLHRTDGFACCTSITNQHSSEIPIGTGWHPYFRLGNQLDDLSLQLPSCKKILLGDRMLPTGEKLTLNDRGTSISLKEIFLDAIFEIDASDGIATTSLRNHKEQLDLCVWQETGFRKYNFITIYIPPSRDSIAIEPCSSNIDAFNNDDGLIVLSPGESISVSFGVKLLSTS